MANSKNKKQKTVYKPYLKGPVFHTGMIGQAMRLLSYQLIFIVFYLLLSMPLSADSLVIRVVMALTVLFVCGTFVYIDGQHVGVTEAAHGEICYNRREEGKSIDPKDQKLSFNAVKPVLIVMMAVLIPFVICLLHALMAKEEAYALQSLPTWASSASGFDDAAGLAYYDVSNPFTFSDICRVIARTLIFPFIAVAPTTSYSLRLTLDRLSPVLVILPFLSYIPGYWSGRRLRATMHGDIDKNKRRVNKQRKNAERKREERRKATELI